MHKRDLTPKEIHDANAQQTYELLAMARNLSFWLDGVHHPSEGEYLEYAVRSYLRRRIPRRFEISTGFISLLEANTQNDNSVQVTRKVSRQFDILIWDADTYPPLFRADNFVILMPESVRAIIEITKCLNAKKILTDLQKLDDLYELYSPERQKFRPYTAMLALSSKKVPITNFLQYLEKFYLFDSDIPITFRYGLARNKSTENRPFALCSFIDSICILDKGLIKGKMEKTLINPDYIVRYDAYGDKPNQETSFGMFERDVILNLSQAAALASGYWESSVDVYREFMQGNSHKACGSLVIEDWELIMPSMNVLENLNPPITENRTHDIKNFSQFVGADFIDNYPQPTMYIEHFGSNNWAFERHAENIFACGRYSKGVRVKTWRIFCFDKNLREARKYFVAIWKSETAGDTKKDFTEFLQDLKSSVWENNLQKY